MTTGITLIGDFAFEQYWHNADDSNRDHEEIARNAWGAARKAQAQEDSYRMNKLRVRVKELEARVKELEANGQ